MNPFTGTHYENILTNDDNRCFTCNHFIGCNEAGDVRCKKEIKGFMKYRDKNTVVKCKKNKWYND